MNLGSITWGGIASATLGFYIPYASSQLAGGFFSTTLTQIGGSSRAIISNNDRMDNVSQTFSFKTIAPVHQQDLMTLHQKFQDWLLSVSADDYGKLYFDAYPGYYWLAIVTAIEPFTMADDNSVTCSVTFSLVPYAFDAKEDYYHAISNGTNLVNSHKLDALPLWHIKGTGNGSFDLNGVTYNFLDLSGDLYVDADTQDIYDGAGDYTPQEVQFDNYQPPILVPGDNIFNNISAITLEVNPRWRVNL